MLAAPFATFPAGPLLAALRRLCAVVEKRSVIPILECVMIAPGLDGSAVLVTTDMGMWWQETVPAEVLPGAIPPFCVGAYVLRDLLAGIAPGEQVAFAAAGDTCSLSAPGFTTSLPTRPVTDFPAGTAAGSPPNPWAITLSVAEVRRLFGTVAHAISREETRYYLQGTHLQSRAGTLRATTTDSHRLARVTLPAPPGLPDLEAIVPQAATAALLKALPKQGSVTLAYLLDASGQPTRLHCAFEGTALTTKLISAEYPDMDRIIPRADDRPHVLTVPAKVLADAAKRIKAADSPTLRLSLSATGCRVRSTGYDTQLALPLPGATYTGDDMEIGFECRCVAEIMAAAGGTATLRFGDPIQPARITGADSAALFVLMPRRV